MDYDPELHRYLVVFEDHRDTTNSDIRGIFVSHDGTLEDAPTSGTDHTFGICTNSGNIYTCSVAFNAKERIYLVVWGDSRKSTEPQPWSTGEDVYGQLVDADGTLLPPTTPADPAVNFGIATIPDYEESVADVTWSSITNEFFVVYGTSIGMVFGQRINSLGKYVMPDGIVLSKTTGGMTSILISDHFINGPDCLQSRVQANNEYDLTVDSWCECEVIWKGIYHEGRTDNDIWGQRVGFFLENGRYTAKLLDLDGNTIDSPSNHSISYQNEYVGPPDIAFSTMDNEFLIGWGDPRVSVEFVDLYCQRLGINTSTNEMSFLADDRLNTVTDTENIPLLVSGDKYEGSMVGIAHSDARNEFLMAFTYKNPTLNRKSVTHDDPAFSLESDIMGMILYGTAPSAVEGVQQLPMSFEVKACYPNPFNPETSVRFSVPVASRVTATVCDLMGRKITTLFDGIKKPGVHTVVWDGKDALGMNVPTGIYLCQISCGAQTNTVKMMLVR